MIEENQCKSLNNEYKEGNYCNFDKGQMFEIQLQHRSSSAAK